MWLGLDIAQHSAAALVADETRQPLAALRVALSSSDPASVWLAAMQVAREALAKAGVEASQVTAATIAVNLRLGPDGIVLPGEGAWSGFDLPRALREHLRVARSGAATRLTCQAMGEAAFGALQGCDDWLWLHLGARIESVACVQNHIVRGADGAAGAIGALCVEAGGALSSGGRRGGLDGYCSDESFRSRAAGYGLSLKSAREIWSLAATNFAAQAICDDFIARLAQGVGATVCVLNPRRIALGGPLAHELGDDLLPPLRAKVGEFCLPVHAAHLELVGAALGEDAALWGAMAKSAEC